MPGGAMMPLMLLVLDEGALFCLRLGDCGGVGLPELEELEGFIVELNV